MTATAAAPTVSSPTDDPVAVSVRHLLAHLAALEARVAAAVERFRTTDPEPGDPLRGVYLSDPHIDALLHRDGPAPPGAPRPLPHPGPPPPDGAPTVAEASRLGLLQAAPGLDGTDVDLLVAALAPDLDPRFEQLYGYLQDDVTRRRPSVGLALRLAGCSVLDPRARDRLTCGSRLTANGLVVVEDPERPLLGRSLRVADRVAHHLLGGDRPPADVARLLVDGPSDATPRAEPLARALAAGARVVALHGPSPAGPFHLGRAAAAGLGRRAVVADLRRAGPDRLDDAVDAVVLEAVLADAVLVIGPAAVVPPAALVRAASAAPPVVLWGAGPALDLPLPDPPLVLGIGPPLAAEEAAHWRAALDPVGDGDVAPPTSFRLAPEDIARTVRAGRLGAAADGAALTTGALAKAARSLASTGLEALARRVEPSTGWGDLVIPAATGVALHQLAARVAHRGTVLDEWGMRRGGGRGEGVTALFAGPSGTGKTLAAEAIAGELGLPLYVIDLSAVVDKYIGETEKNLERIFAEAEDVDAVLFFDEADALFGKRSEVSDARDRYANVEVAYLLQRMETFDGLAVLASNLRANLDDAFLRRLGVVVDFAEPGPAERRELWARHLGGAPLADDVDLDFCATRFALTGGNIRNIAVAAAYLGADRHGTVGMRELVEATEMEYRKLGRLCLAHEFGPYHHLVLDERRPQGGEARG